MPCPSFLSFPSATSSSHTPAGWPGGGVMPPIRDVLLPWLRPDSSSRRISLSRFLNALYACFRSSSVAISRSPGNLFHMRPYRSGYRGSCTHENRFAFCLLRFVISYIIGILALFGHFSTLLGPLVRRLGFRPCESCRF